MQERTSLAEFLISIPLFREAAPDGLDTLIDHLEPVEARAGDVLIRQGEVADGLYVLVSGRVRASVATPEGERDVAELSRGHLFGEISLLTSRARTATVRAVRDSFLLRLPQKAFEALAAENPQLVAPLSEVVVDRLLRAENGQEEERVRTLAVLPVGGRVAEEACRALHQALAESGPTVTVTPDRLRELSGVEPGAISHSTNPTALVEALRRIEAEHRFVIYLGDAQMSPWTECCLREGDRIVVVADTEDSPHLTDLEAALAAVVPPAARVSHELVLVRPAHRAEPQGTAHWLAPRPAYRHHHVRAGDRADHQRLARALSDRAQGLVLGGGGARGFAHLGVLKALDDVGIPIDHVGGTSIGAVMGGLYAVGLDHDERMDAAEEVFLKNSLFRPTLPLVSITSGSVVSRLMEAPHLRAQTPIEDMPRSYFCISANLSRAEVVIHDRGPIAAAMRASFSIPGIFPPVSRNGDLLVDGGVMNNLPVDVMRARLGGGRIIAVDLRPDVDLTVTGEAPLSVSGWRYAWQRLRGKTLTELPNVGEILLRTLELGSTRSQRDALAAAATDLYLRPPVEGCGLLDFKAGRGLVDLAYRTTLTEIDKDGTLIRTSS